jgi:hypothetical protein
MLNPASKTSLSVFALIAGLGILCMATSPFAEFMVYGKLVVAGNPAETCKNILAHQTLFKAGILSYVFNFICDIVVAWALYGLLKPVNESLSLLTAWFQLVYATLSLVAVVNLVTVLRLLGNTDDIKVFGTAQVYTQVMLTLHAFRDGWSLGFFLFALNLMLRGFLVFKSGYIPKIVGILLMIAGLGYFINTLQPFLFPNVNIDYITITYFGELVFMFWLLIRGWRIKESNLDRLSK